jgi:hypothetical protein
MGGNRGETLYMHFAHGLMKATTEVEAGMLNQSTLMKLAPVVNPATIRGSHLVSVPETRIRLKHPGRIGFQHPPLRFSGCIVPV